MGNVQIEILRVVLQKRVALVEEVKYKRNTVRKKFELSNPRFLPRSKLNKILFLVYRWFL